ncbi:TPA: hypothetical protein DCY43_01685 [candidate division WWE3 bacterium]|uniref:Uncharacterized protein n=3 Tax=Katanobacteria TaxID=422282 RepID=A0A0G1KHC6_UNCKA|nr:MAG: hypothetical protein UW82_C0046G0004 [candidate division WWE3 bacterium GW2011_GWC2_44_9]OGC51935.1 MAG: hypothetical protein A2709_02455 [candidate division WWE3 bacterium RIFCSPHIGHO2_01_FULL_43_9]HAZ29449.1 hypothetical protein [candidate division WWE3 bacterium]
MIQDEYIKSKLASTKCYKCGATLENGTFAVLNDRMPLVTIGHVVCAACHSQSMVTLTMAGSGIMPMMTDLESEEIIKFAGLSEIAYTDLLDLHKALKRESLCKLLHKKEKTSAKKIKH